MKTGLSITRIASLMEDPLVVTDREGRVEWVNPAFTELSGCSLKDVVGRLICRLLTGPDSDPTASAAIRKAVENGRPHSAEVLRYTCEGRPYWVSLKLQPVLDKQKRVTAFFAVEREITERKLLEQALQNQVVELYGILCRVAEDDGPKGKPRKRIRAMSVMPQPDAMPV
jgi:two-component system, NtrC family, sensor kinase